MLVSLELELPESTPETLPDVVGVDVGIKNGKGTEPVSPKARKANRRASKWAFAELHSVIAYKAVLSGSLAIKVDANNTSKACPMCGYTDKRNRPEKGLLFICQNEQCQYRQQTDQPYTLHADLIGARNIAMRTLLTRQGWVRTGVLSVRPDVSDRNQSGTLATGC